ncbi:hypothetical protein AEGHOMDF_3537 [Methylobacterium soli]|nr:hypothetical protein AEGHOMDF_3537 [Methylobacterium soli]
MIAAWTSRAAPSMSRLSPNSRTIRTVPVELVEVISLTSAMAPRRRSSGAATVVAMVSGLAPAICAWTRMTGKSTCGRGATGSFRKAKRPASSTPMVRSVVATGRRMNGSETFTAAPRRPPPRPDGGP